MRRTLSQWTRGAFLCVVCVSLSVGACGTSDDSPEEQLHVQPYTIAPGFGVDLVLSPEHVQWGVTYAGWSARWWEWAYDTPGTDHPLFDKTGAHADVNQVDPVWFLGPIWGTQIDPGDGTVVRDITIPQGVGLFFPIFCVGIDNQTCKEPDTAYTYTELRSLASAEVHSVADLLCTIDGVPILEAPTLDEAARFRAQSPEAYANAPEDSVNVHRCGEPPGGGRIGPIASDGVFMMVAPMPSGAHTVQFQAQDTAGGGSVNVTYNITVR